MNIKIDYEAVEATITSLTTTLRENQTDLSEAYTSISSLFVDSSGKEAEALRDLQKAEASMMRELYQTITAFSKSIRFASDSFKQVDTTGAKSMY